MTVEDNDRLWRDQNLPGMSDEDLEKIVETFGNDIKVPEKSTKIKSEIALEIAEDSINRLFVDEYQVPYAAIQVNDHLEVLPLRSGRFRDYLANEVYKSHRLFIGDAIKDVIDILSAKAKFDSGDPIKLNLRIAQVADKWYYDLTNKEWEFVEITSSGWSIKKNEIIFKRYSNQQSQVYPTEEYEADIFDKFMSVVNIKANDEESKLLLKIYIVCLMIPDIQKPVLMLHGSQGSAKSSLQEMIKMLIDPSAVKTFSFPRDINELIQQLNHNQVVYYDNISIVKDYISDQLCRAVTGSGSSKRQLYTDDDDIIYSYKRIVGFNGINLGATKPDLLDRGLIIELERIDESRQLKPEDLWKQFEQIRPQLLGYILDILVKLLEWKNNPNRPELILNRLPRMAEFAEYGEMISRCMGNPGNLFINAYRKNIELQSREVIDSSTIAPAIIQLMTRRNDEDWIGNATSLLAELKEDAETLKIDTGKYWPKSPSLLSRRLNEIKVNLKQVGIEIHYSHDGKQRIITICKVPLMPLVPLNDPNQARIDDQNTNDIPNDTNDIPLIKNEENHTQSNNTNDTNDTNDIIQVLDSKVKCPDCDEITEPYYMKFHTQNTGHKDWRLQ